MKWHEYSRDLWHEQKLPEERKYVLVQVEARDEPARGLPPSVAVGYLKYAAGDKRSPQFIVPGVGGPVVAWCDCLPKDFNAPLWPGTHKQPNSVLDRNIK
jgi:hypothetical protein